MSYAGTYGADETCKHDLYYRSCAFCSNPHAVRAAKRGETHYDNGAGYCVGCPLDDAGDCTTLVRYCPILNTAAQVAKNRHADAQSVVTAAEARVQRAKSALNSARQELADARMDERRLRRQHG